MTSSRGVWQRWQRGLKTPNFRWRNLWTLPKVKLCLRKKAPGTKSNYRNCYLWSHISPNWIKPNMDRCIFACWFRWTPYMDIGHTPTKSKKMHFLGIPKNQKNDHNSSLQYQIEIKLCEHDNHGNKMITRPQ